MSVWRTVYALVGVLLIIGAVGYAAHGSATPPGAGTTPGYTPPDTARAVPARLELPAHPRVLFIGDSFTYGQGASVRTRGFVYVAARTLGWRAEIHGYPGSGYITPGPLKQTYVQALQKLAQGHRSYDLVAVQGSVNDQAALQSGKDINGAVHEALDVIRKAWPSARVLFMAPVPQRLPATPANVTTEATLRAVAAESGCSLIDPIGENWITQDNIGTTLVAANLHPDDAGHAYLAQRLVADIRGGATASIPAA